MSEKKKLVEFCPYCKSKQEFTPIYYGYPSDELTEMAEAGEVILGGCEYDKNSLMHKCNNCGKRY